MIAHRVDEVFALPAEKDGKVIEKDDSHMVIEYNDGTKHHIDLSTRYGISAGSVYPQHQASVFNVGDEVKKGDIVKYNPGFFRPSTLDRRQVQWMAGVMAKTAIMEASYTLEDSSAIDDWLAEQLQSEVTKVKTITVRFDQTLRNLVKEGDHVDIETILCTIEDAVTADSGLFSEDDLETLRLMSAATPLSGANGVVEKIEVFYHGDMDEMSDSLAELATRYDKQRRKTARLLGTEPLTGSVDQSLRIDGNGLELNQMAVRIYITHVESFGVGDKLVFGNQMKSVLGHRLKGVNETQSGVPIRAIFGGKSIIDRIVLSPLLSGFSNTTLRVIGERAAQMWISGKTT